MNEARQPTCENELAWRSALPLVASAVIAFHLAYSFRSCGFLIAIYLWCLFQLTRLGTARQASYLGLLVGLLAYAPQMGFLWAIFGPAAIALWLVLAFWLMMFLVLGRFCRIHFGDLMGVLLLPFLWTGLEYFRSELYYLRFSWLNAGYVFAEHSGWLPLNQIGIYGVGFMLMAGVSLCSLLPRMPRGVANAALLVAFGIVTNLPPAIDSNNAGFTKALPVAGVQLEFPTEQQVILGLNELVKKFPQAELLVLSEYTFTGPVPDSVKNWCRKNHRYLVVGAEEPAPNSNYYDTAFVIGPDGDIVFQQGKCVPIQFFKDGLPAKEQKLWDSPWGKIGFCVCYDLSYTRVTDQLVRLGAEAIIVPTMDVADWGRRQHELHARVAPVRAAEYGIPIFRMASSGISQCVDATGRVRASAPMTGDGAMLCGELRLGKAGALPWDRWVAPLCVGVTGLTIGWLGFHCIWRKKTALPTTKTS